jgi:hypothetical protein
MDMQSKLILIGILMAPILVLAAVLGGEQGLQARYAQADAPPPSNDEPGHAQDAGLVCMLLVGSTVLLTGKVWMEKLQHKMETQSDQMLNEGHLTLKAMKESAQQVGLELDKAQ